MCCVEKIRKHKYMMQNCKIAASLINDVQGIHKVKLKKSLYNVSSLVTNTKFALNKKA